MTNPIDNSILCEVAVSAKADVEAALDGAEKAGKAWRAMTMGKRCKILYKFRELMTRPETMDRLSKWVLGMG